MTSTSSLYTFWVLLCISIACFYLFRLVCGRAWLGHFDVENEVGHGIMAIGMIFMLAPAGLLFSVLIRWNILLFASAALWWIFRLFVRKPLLALLAGRDGERTPFRSDAIHVFMHIGMCYMFFLLSSMAFSMTQLATALDYGFCFCFALLTFYYIRESYRDFQAAKKDWLQFGANLAHVLMSGMMCWMFLEMIAMTMNMRA